DLTSANPEFLYNLAFPAAFALPSGTPAEDVGTDPVPATGPYIISRYVPDEVLELERNDRFEPWNGRPDGFADRIVVQLKVKPEKLVGEVLEDRADSIVSAALIPA